MELLFLLAWFAICAEQDARQRLISNWLTLGGFTLALAYLLYSGHTWLGFESADAGWALLLAVALTLPGYALGRLGAGDVKLLAALALASSSLHLLGTFIGAGLVMLIWLIIRQKAWPLIGQRVTQRYTYMNAEATNKQPFSPFLFTGFLLTALCIH
ncbi:prepilin peptidase [Pseudomonas sp. KFB-139]|uniref:Prepilin peptidase n=1 Tax=Pseudomonas serbiensis TaxID=3064350 RepID=A0ABT9D0N6_9PSED|nr:prepilin peptidase [Pseudomonas sp. KFB-138]MDO7930035.1 prepilin peptidase [Pseudomonas sp. KFB-138]